mmetsp:Transcript_44896/g.106549  ORF Transcript_44896/g.106549 Transcript_44896/m.106549 type:complete len:217 (+) Transcript_44896:2041-2691(+)
MRGWSRMSTICHFDIGIWPEKGMFSITVSRRLVWGAPRWHRWPIPMIPTILELGSLVVSTQKCAWALQTRKIEPMTSFALRNAGQVCWNTLQPKIFRAASAAGEAAEACMCPHGQWLLSVKRTMSSRWRFESAWVVVSSLVLCTREKWGEDLLTDQRRRVTPHCLARSVGSCTAALTESCKKSLRMAARKCSWASKGSFRLARPSRSQCWTLGQTA